MLQSSLVFSYDFDLAPAAGAVTTNREFPPMDLSHADALLIELNVTKAEDDADDTLDVKLQFANPDGFWDTVARFTAVAGNATVSVAAPESQRLTLNQLVDLAATEEAYEPTWSAGAAELTAGTVRNGPFPGKRRTVAGWQPNVRVSFVKTDVAGSDAEYEGTVRVWALTRI